MSKFSKLTNAYDPSNRTAELTLPVATKDDHEGRALHVVLTLKHAGESNRRWRDAINRYNAKTGLARKTAQGRGDADSLALERDLELYPKHVITGWRHVADDDGADVPFTEQDCREFLQALPRWVFDEIRIFAVTAVNFIPDEEPSQEEVNDQAGK